MVTGGQLSQESQRGGFVEGRERERFQIVDGVAPTEARGDGVQADGAGQQPFHLLVMALAQVAEPIEKGAGAALTVLSLFDQVDDKDRHFVYANQPGSIPFVQHLAERVADFPPIRWLAGLPLDAYPPDFDAFQLAENSF